MSDMHRQTNNHQIVTFGSGQTQFFESEALSADHPKIQARERARQQSLQLSSPTEKQARPAEHLKSSGDVAPTDAILFQRPPAQKKCEAAPDDKVDHRPPKEPGLAQKEVALVP